MKKITTGFQIADLIRPNTESAKLKVGQLKLSSPRSRKINERIKMNKA